MHKRRCSCCGHAYPVEVVRDFHEQFGLEVEEKRIEYGARPRVNQRDIDERLFEIRERRGRATMLPIIWPRYDTPEERQRLDPAHRAFQREFYNRIARAHKLLLPIYDDTYECIGKAPYWTIYEVAARHLPIGMPDPWSQIDDD